MSPRGWPQEVRSKRHTPTLKQFLLKQLIEFQFLPQMLVTYLSMGRSLTLFMSFRTSSMFGTSLTPRLSEQWLPLILWTPECCFPTAGVGSSLLADPGCTGGKHGGRENWGRGGGGGGEENTELEVWSGSSLRPTVSDGDSVCSMLGSSLRSQKPKAK